MNEIWAFLQQPDMLLHIEAMVLGSARLIIFVSLVPFLGPQLTTPVLFPLILAFYLPLHPYLMTATEQLLLVNYRPRPNSLFGGAFAA